MAERRRRCHGDQVSCKGVKQGYVIGLDSEGCTIQKVVEMAVSFISALTSLRLKKSKYWGLSVLPNIQL